jgi:hypothetical protein
MSEEHLWPKWMHPFLPKLELAEREEVSRRTIMKDTLIENLTKYRQGYVYTKSVKCVCKKCNETWMGRIETHAKPILIPMLRGEMISLDSDAMKRLYRWFALKVMVIEGEEPQDFVVPQQARTSFMYNRNIPEGMKIWLATHNTERWYTGLWHQTLTASLSSEPPLFAHLKNVQTTAFGVGRIFSLTFMTTLAGFDLEPPIEAIGVVKRLWPRRGGLFHWPMRIISSEGADRLSQLIEEFMHSPIAEWRPLP